MSTTILFFVSLLITTWLGNSNDPDGEILTQTSEMYRKDLQAFDSQIKKFISIAKKFQEDELSTETLKQEFQNTRLSYKRIELFMEYFEREAVSKYINGAPLPKLETSAPGINIIQPNGLQTLDELMVSEEIHEEAEEILNLAEKLNQFWTNLYIIEKSKKFQHRFIMEAIRFQIWRIYTLGLTGFDTPGSLAGIDESISSIESLIQYLLLYNNFARDMNVADIYELVIDRLFLMKEYLQSNNDFNELDRMYVLREFVNPIYKGIYKLHRGLNIEYSDEVDPTSRALNYHADLPFSDDFLDKSYYALVSNEELSNTLRIKLGKTLFYDPIMSRDLNMSCASCHKPEMAFTDGLAKSMSNQNGVTTLRNAPSLINSVYAEKYFYDLREYSLERQVKHVIYDKKEFNMDFVELVDRLKQSDEYRALFDQAFGDTDKYGISTWSISNALAAYVASLSSWNSEFDKYARGETGHIDQDVIDGYNLFMGKAACGTCHFAPVFNGTIAPNYLESESEVLGVPYRPDTLNALVDSDPGRIASGKAIDEPNHFLFAFKTTTVRNVEHTAPYMHNGVFSKLDDVLDFYNRGGGAGIGIELENQTLASDPLNLNEQELSQLKSFLHSLSDTIGLTDSNVSLPVFNIPEYDNRELNY